MLIIFYSRLFSVINLKTFTVLFCPNQCALSMAYKSFIGLKSWSNIITILAAVKLRPRPPIFVFSNSILYFGFYWN